ncbi:MAG: YggS family pyridoxal phosphate-dependent enzyme, partial [Alphaproteobacteria bacterium HGW-Alphaproteobacteria-13]
IVLHLIGQLQSNKAEDAALLFDAIHSLDRPSLVSALARACDKAGRQPLLFVQVNVGDETQKGGCAVADLPVLLEQARGAGLTIAGLMAIPPATVEPAPYFALLDELAERHGLPLRSMGMSGDYETAVMLGATHVRVGTALFGTRE